MLKIKLNKILNALGVKFSEEQDKFIITDEKTPDVKYEASYNSFPEVKYDYNTGNMFVEVDSVDDVDEVLTEIFEYIKEKKEEMKKAQEKINRLNKEGK